MSPEGSKPCFRRRAVRALTATLVLLAVACTDPSSRNEASANTDAIQELVDRLSADRSGEWVNGLYPKLDLPRSATVEEVFDRMFQRVSFDDGRVTRFRILELRGVVIESLRPEQYNAAVVETDLGRKLVLFRRERLDWWTRVYEIEPSA